MDWTTLIFGLIGGLGMFLFGMRLMSEGLRSVASDRLRSILSRITRNVYIAIAAGAGVTALLQSSSATTVLIVGLVNAGLLTLKQALCIVLGANVGTTITAWMVSAMAFLKPTTYALPAIGVGFAMTQLARRAQIRQWGQVLLGFGILFFGLSVMKEGFGPLKDSARAASMLGSFGTNPLLGILVGTAFTMLLQSSSATIAIVQVLAFQGVIPFAAALPLVLGDNVGTTITVEIAALGGTRTAHRTARSHTLFNLAGVAIILPFIYNGWYAGLIQRIIPGELTSASVMVHIAAAHTLFNVLNANLWAPLVDVLCRVVTRIVPGEDPPAPATGPKHLAKHLLENPATAIQAAIEELVHMAQVARDTVRLALDTFFTGDEKKIRDVRCYEEALDKLQISITDYLIEIAERDPDQTDSRRLPVLIHSVNDLEKIGDYCFNLTQLVERMNADRLTIPPHSVPILRALAERVDSMLGHLILGLRERSLEHANEILKIESEIDDLRDRGRHQQIASLLKREHDPRAEILSMDFATNIEKMGDHITNIAQALKGDLSWVSKLGEAESEPVTRSPVPPDCDLAPPAKTPSATDIRG